MNNYISPELELAQYKEKYALRNNVTKLGVLFILYDLIFMYIMKRVFVYVYYAISTRSLNFNQTIMNKYYEVNSDLIKSSMFSMLYSCFVILMSLIFAVITAHYIGIRVLNTIKVNKKSIRLGLLAYPIMLLTNTCLTYVTSIITNIFKKNGTTIPTADFSVDKASASAIILTILYLVVVAPIAEEIVFRGFILKAITPFSRKGAIVLSALLFALMHKNIPQAVGAFGIGIIFAIIDTKANSIVPSIIMHSLNNLLPCLLDINASAHSTVIVIIYNVLFRAIVLVGIAILAYKGRPLFSLKSETESEESALSERKKRFEIFLNPLILIYIITLLSSLVFNLIEANAHRG